MKILLDVCTPVQVRHALAGHDARTAVKMGWGELENGALLAAAENGRDEYAAFISNLKNSIGTRNFVRETVLRFLEAYGAAAPHPLLHTLNSEQREIYDRSKRHPIGTYLFSDTVVVYAPLANDLGEPGLRGVYSVLTACASTMMICMAARVPVRGAVEIGVAIPWDNGELYGPAFLAAYELEQRTAQWPRVVVGPELAKSLQDFAAINPHPIEAALRAEMGKICLTILGTDDDQVPIVDYLGEGMRRMLQGSQNADLVSRGLSFVAAEHERFTTQGNAKLAARYATVRRYFESRRGRWL